MNKNNRTKYLVKNTLIFAVGNFATKMISFFLVPLYTHLLSTAQYGTIDLVATVRTVLVPILTLNIGESVMRFSLDKNADRNKIVNIGLTILALATLIGLLVIPAVQFIPDLSEYNIYIYFSIISMGYTQVLLSNLRGQEKLAAYTLGNIIHSLFIAVLNVIFLLCLGMGVKGYFASYIVSNLIIAVYAFIAGGTIKAIKHYSFDKALFKAMAKYSVVLIPTSFMWWIMNSSDRLMISTMIGTSANGIYAISYKVPTLMTMITNVFTQAWSYSAIREDDSEDRDEYSNNVFNNLVAVVVTAGAGMIMLMKPFLRYYVSESFYEAWKYTPYLVIGFVFMTLGTFMSTSYTVHKDSKGFLFSGTCGAVMNIVCNFLLIPLMGISGAALATCLSYFTVFIYRVIDTRKHLKIKAFPIRHIIAYVVLICAGATMFIDNIYGQILLIIEFLIITVINIKSLLSVLMPIIHKYK